MTAELCTRWPTARIRGIDASTEMINDAARLAIPGRLDFAVESIEAWDPGDDAVDVIVANASLQWVPTHVALIPRWIRALRPGGTLAFQIPPAGSAASRVFRAVATSPRWEARLGTTAAGSGPWSDASPVLDATGYLTRLAELGLAVTVWETTYLHLLAGDDPVLEWFAGTALRPYFEALGSDAAAIADFRAEIGAALREAYPRTPHGTVLPFRRVFVVARRT